MAFTGEASFALVDWSRGIIGLRFTLFFPLTSNLCFSCCGWTPTYPHHIAVGCFLNLKHRKESTPDVLQVLLRSPISASEPFQRTLSRQTLDIYFIVRQFALWMCPFLHFDYRRRGVRSSGSNICILDLSGPEAGSLLHLCHCHQGCTYPRSSGEQWLERFWPIATSMHSKHPRYFNHCEAVCSCMSTQIMTASHRGEIC